MTNYYDLNYKKLMPEALDARILDVGCGDGDFIRYAHSLGYRNITAVDIDEAALAELAKLEGVRTIVAEADGAFIDAMREKFDLILVKQMIYYLPRTKAPDFVRALRDALADGGRLIVEIFNGMQLSTRLTQAKDPFIQTMYNEKGLSRLLASQGLVVEQLSGAKLAGGSFLRAPYLALRWIWTRIWLGIMILERGYDDELPKIHEKWIISVSRR